MSSRPQGLTQIIVNSLTHRGAHQQVLEVIIPFEVMLSNAIGRRTFILPINSKLARSWQCISILADSCWLLLAHRGSLQTTPINISFVTYI